MDVKHLNHIGIYENAISEDFCNKIIKYFDQNAHISTSRQQIDGVNTLSKKDQSIFLPDMDFLTDTIFHKEFTNQFYSSIYPLYKNEYPNIDDAGQNFIRKFKIQKTEPSGGYHVWHSEYTSLYTQRIAVYTLYLNDNFEAGETEFLYQQYRLKPKTGTVCIFPASYTHVHRGNPPIGGTKYIVTGWVEV